MRYAAIVVACLLSASTALADERSVYTPTHGSKCIDRSREYEGAWSCPGPSGYAADFSDEGNLAAISVRPPRRWKRPAAAYAFRGLGRVFGDIVDWRVADDTPTAAVLRIWRAATQADGSELEVQELAVFKITPQESCLVASVDARQPAANEAARRLATEAAEMPCHHPE
jgi:hypothetical protein